ncbi:MAG: sulfatase-like hydrolase/transferase, partial [Gammaproteobacteria bacterium]|nr:sulfatase-like hydrolase/transferase [Gammaproteobacteria bacterium]
ASGYETVYATDEKRFSNIDQHFGFETLVGPKFGAADFVIGTLHDFPLTNLISNTSLGRMLFPYTYGNRAHIHTYKPDSFNELIDRYLQRRDPDRPLFMSTHFCLAHWPFRWADTESMSREPWPPAAPYEDSKPFYVNSIEATDKQFGRLIDSFSKAGLLENTLVVLLSDHGEGLVMAKDNHLPGYESTEELQVETGGHGTNIDATRQYEVLLALREYGAGQFPVRRIEQMTSLIDIAPTILDYLDLPASEMDGMSLLGLIDEDPATISQFDNRILTLESGYSTQALLSLLPKVEDTLRESAKTYAVNERGRIVIKPQYIDELILKKQRGVISGDWQLSTYRYVREDRYKQRLFNRKSRQYWEDEGLQVADGPLDELTAETCRRFASDEPFAKSDLCRNTALRLAEQQQ